MKVLAILVLLGGSVLGAEYWVAPDGDDDGAGTVGEPFATIQRGVDAAGSGDTVWVREGAYAERVYLGEGVRLRAVPGELVVLDGSGMVVGEGWDALVSVEVRDVVVEGLVLTGLRTDLAGRVPIGILVAGAAGDVVLRGNVIRDLGTDFIGREGGDAHGIAVYGEGVAATDGVQIIGNELRDLRLGSSEALVVNGNVTGFLIEGNVVADCNNIGIDVIGHEGTGPTPETDRARDGVVRANTVTGISSVRNPAYGGEFDRPSGKRSAGGIYVDGGTRVLVERNSVTRCDIGIELASEHAGKKTDLITVRNNAVVECTEGGIFLGGYDEQRGSTEECVVRNNTLSFNDWGAGSGQILLQHYVRNCRFSQNMLTVNSTIPFVVAPYESYAGNVFDWNWYSVAGTALPVWVWRGEEMEFGRWAQVGHDANGGFTWSGYWFDKPTRPVVGSGAVDAGDPAFVPDEGELDFRGAPRVLGTVDAGAWEVDGDGMPEALGGVKVGRDGVVRVRLGGTGRRPFFWESQDLVNWVAMPQDGEVYRYSGPSGWVISDGRYLGDGKARYYRVSFEPVGGGG